MDYYRADSCAISPLAFLLLLQGLYGGNIHFFINHWGGDYAQAKASISSLLDLRPDCRSVLDFQNYSTFLEYEKTINDPIYIRNTIVGGLWHDEDLADNSGLAEILAAINNAPSDYGACTLILVGGSLFFENSLYTDCIL